MSTVPSLSLGVPHYLLAVSIVAVWVPPLRLLGRTWPLWPVLFTASLVAGVSAGTLTVASASLLLLLAALLWLGRSDASNGNAADRFNSPVDAQWLRSALFVVGVLLALAFAVHGIPGFIRGLVIPETRITPDAALYSQYLNFDKGAAGLLLLALACRRIEWAEDWVRTVKVGVVVAWFTLALAIPVALLTDYVHYAPKFPDFALTFLFVNLFFTCVAEEAFFRGVVQEKLHQWCERAPWCNRAPQQRWIPIAVVILLALPFGVAHTRSSLAAFAFVFVASISYGIAYLKTRSIESSILVHFLVNAVHFLLFTYPYRLPQ